MQGLPGEVEDLINAGMVCLRQHNGAPSRHGMIIVLDVDFDTKIEGDVEKQLFQVVGRALNRAHKALDNDIPWRFVANVRSDQWECETSGTRENMYQVCVHLGDDNEKYLRNGPPLFSYAFEEDDPIDPRQVLAYFDHLPPFVRGVAVSGVHETVIRDEWTNCIAKEPNTFCRNGRGYMAHPMVVLPEGGNGSPDMMDGFTVREQSFNFSWADYPGQRGNDW